MKFRWWGNERSKPTSPSCAVAYRTELTVDILTVRGTLACPEVISRLFGKSSKARTDLRVGTPYLRFEANSAHEVGEARV